MESESGSHAVARLTDEIAGATNEQPPAEPASRKNENRNLKMVSVADVIPLDGDDDF